eukprot:TRINITY_DN66063_c0_g1_i1.p1 TRINITY_DN66063_c0_g1~~TRINITY_DN66063_c0_g1_i1.p1  ORF type:complete len:406 (-),score=73.42 TRINITY_DN66063_c0_g1_i1:130-1347(-)
MASSSNAFGPVATPESSETSANSWPTTLISNSGACKAGLAIALLMLILVLEGWNSSLRAVLFQEGVMDGPVGHKSLQQFDSVFALALLQLVFMGMALLLAWRLLSQNYSADVKSLERSIFDWRWMALFGSFVFSFFLAQALIMPRDIMTLGAFAITRAMEVPFAAFLRAPVGGVRQKRALVVSAVTFANFAMFYSFLRMEGCICIWTGHGIALSGLAFYLIYFMIIFAPAVNMLMQESIATNFGVHPLLIIATQSILAAGLFSPAIFASSVRHALWLLFEYREMALLVFWICLQTTASVALLATLIHYTDSFWASSLKSWRAVYWWLQQLVPFYVKSGGTLLIVVNPEASTWSLAMFAGCALTVIALIVDMSARGASPVRNKDAAGIGVHESSHLLEGAHMAKEV